MENYQMRRGCGRPYNTTCGMGNQRYFPCFLMVVGQKTTIKTPVKMTFKSSNPKVAAVNSTGKVTAKAKGNATITAKTSDVTWTYKIKVEKPKLSNIKLSVYTKTSRQLKLKGTSRKVTWSSSAPSVVSVNKGSWLPLISLTLV